MIGGFDDSVGRRRFLLNLAWLTAGGAGLVRGAGVQRGPDASEDAPNTHNMLAVGRDTVFLSHLPMFEAADRTEFTSPHRFQVILEASFATGGRNVTPLYTADRAAHAGTRIYTVGPDPDSFVLAHLFTPSDKPRVSAFKAKVFRGHLEHRGIVIPGLQDVEVRIARVVHAHKFDPRAKKPDQLEYIVFGKGRELFLAHTITGPPDFDHVFSARMTGHTFTATELRQDVRVVFGNRKNVAAERLRTNQSVEGTLLVGGAATAPAIRVQVQPGVEFYFEEGELLVPPTFDPTAEERKAVA
jgi:hypothetical protein